MTNLQLGAVPRHNVKMLSVVAWAGLHVARPGPQHLRKHTVSLQTVVGRSGFIRHRAQCLTLERLPSGKRRRRFSANGYRIDSMQA